MDDEPRICVTQPLTVAPRIAFERVQPLSSLITVEFLKRSKGTEFVMTHTRFATVESRDSHARGWSRAVESFAKFVEN